MNYEEKIKIKLIFMVHNSKTGLNDYHYEIYSCWYQVLFFLHFLAVSLEDQEFTSVLS